MLSAARLRGLATGALTATLAVAAHATAGGGLPSGPAIVELLLVASTIGAIAFTTSAGVLTLVVLLSEGQLVGHLVLGAVDHSHAAQVGAPAAAMMVTHAAAVAIGAVLIAAGERLCAAVSRAVRASGSTPVQLACVAPVVLAPAADQPMRSTLLLAASMSHRGPPVRFAF